MSLTQVTTTEQWEFQHLLRKEQKVKRQLYLRHTPQELELLKAKHERLLARINERLVGAN